MSDAQKTITIFDEENKPVQMFRAPADKYAARSLWVFLVDNLQSGFVVQLSINDSDGEAISEIVRHSGQKVPVELYKSLMQGREEV